MCKSDDGQAEIRGLECNPVLAYGQQIPNFLIHHIFSPQGHFSRDLGKKWQQDLITGNPTGDASVTSKVSIWCLIKHELKSYDLKTTFQEETDIALIRQKRRNKVGVTKSWRRKIITLGDLVLQKTGEETVELHGWKKWLKISNFAI